MAEKKRPRLRPPPAELPFRWGPKAPESAVTIPQLRSVSQREAEVDPIDPNSMWQAITALPEHPVLIQKTSADRPFQLVTVALPRTWIQALESLIQHWAGGHAPRFWAVAADRYFRVFQNQSWPEQRLLPEGVPGELFRYPIPFPIELLPELAGNRTQSQQERLRIFVQVLLLSWDFWPDTQPEALRALFPQEGA